MSIEVDDTTSGDERLDPADERGRIRSGVLFCLKVFVVAKVGLSVLALASVALLPDATRIPGAAELQIPGPVGVPGWAAQATTAGWHNMFTAWERFDALWFLRIADEGYRIGDGSAAFFPGWPLLIRGGSVVLGGHPFAAATLLGNLAAFGAMVVLYFLTVSERGERQARDAVILLAVFPTAFFLFAPYSEAPFLLFTLLAFWGARREKWWIAGLAGAAAALTRNVGLLLVPALVVEALIRRREDGGRLAPRLLGAVGPAAGTLAVLAYWASVTGDWLEPIHVQTTWQREGAFAGATLVEGTREAFGWIGVFPGGYHLMDWLLVVPVLGAAVWGAFILRPAYSVYVWASMLVPLSYAFEPRPLMSLPRFTLVLFPLLWVGTDLIERRRVPKTALVAGSAATLGALTLLFTNWYYIF